MHDKATDARLRALLGEPDPAVDTAFVARIERAVIAERALQAARARAWTRFRCDAVTSGALAGALGVLWHVAGKMPPAPNTTLGPVAVGLLAVLLWQVVEMPSAARE